MRQDLVAELRAQIDALRAEKCEALERESALRAAVLGVADGLAELATLIVHASACTSIDALDDAGECKGGAGCDCDPECEEAEEFGDECYRCDYERAAAELRKACRVKS